MALQSMTGFARSEGTSGRYHWSWELRSVNGKGLDIRLRLPSGMENLENEAKQRISASFSRGNLQVALSLTVGESHMTALLNRDVLNALLAMRGELGPDILDPAPMRIEALMSVRGLVELQEQPDTEDAIAARDMAIMEGLDAAVAALGEMRRSEGEALAAVLRAQVETIHDLTLVVENDPSRSVAEIARRLDAQVSALMEGAPSLDRDRLHAEAALLATKADLREEVDRLHAHVSAARTLLDNGGPVGRKLDFLAQEFNRESNTICSKSNSVAVTTAGIELKVVIDQFREQIQNLE